MKSPVRATAFVAAAALLWGMDSLLPPNQLSGMPSPVLTLYEHLLALLVILPLAIRKSEWNKLGVKHLLPLFFVGIVGETLAGFFFGDSYRKVGPAAASFLQMLQPFCVLALMLFLKREKRGASYFQWALWVLLGALLIWIFDSSFEVLALEAPGFWGGAGLGLLAVTLWGASNVGAKVLLDTFSPSVVVALRLSLSLIGLAVMAQLRGDSFDASRLFAVSGMGIFVGHSIVFALLPSLLFYRGLRDLPASLATFIALVCPLALVLAPAIFRAKSLHELQWFGGVSVMIGVFLLLRLELEFVARSRQTR